MFPIRPLNCFTRAALDKRSPSRAYRPPTKAPMLVPIFLSINGTEQCITLEPHLRCDPQECDIPLMHAEHPVLHQWRVMGCAARSRTYHMRNASCATASKNNTNRFATYSTSKTCEVVCMGAALRPRIRRSSSITLNAALNSIFEVFQSGHGSWVLGQMSRSWNRDDDTLLVIRSAAGIHGCGLLTGNSTCKCW